MHRRRLLVTALALTLGIGAACSDDEGITIADLVGTWDATQFTLSNPNGVQSLDLIAAGGSFTLTVAANGSFTGEQSLLGQTDTFAGTIVLTGNNTMTLVDATDPSDETDLMYTLNGDQLAITSTDITFDWDGNDVDDPAELEAVLQRQ